MSCVQQYTSTTSSHGVRTVLRFTRNLRKNISARSVGQLSCQQVRLTNPRCFGLGRCKIYYSRVKGSTYKHPCIFTGVSLAKRATGDCYIGQCQNVQGGLELIEESSLGGCAW